MTICASTTKKTFTASLKERRRLSERTFHLVLQTPKIAFTPGDAIAIYPENPKEEVDAILKILGDESLREHLTKEANLSRIPRGLPKAPDLLTFLQNHPISVSELPKLAPLLPRFYSIASSKVATPNEIHLTVVTFMVKRGDRELPGLGSDFLCHRADLNTELTCYIQPNEKFSLPKDSNTPIIMIGPGTGVAPFRGFMQERIQRPSKNWLFFGERTQKDAFYYQDEWEEQIASGHLKLTTAFSRDQEEKIYVQHRMKEHAQELRAWIEEGAVIYICGDAKKMAKEVTATLAEILGAKEHVKALRQSGHLIFDIY